MGRLPIVLLVLWAVLVAGTEDTGPGKGAHAESQDPIGATWAMGAGQAGVRLAADGDINTLSATRMHHANVVNANQGDRLSIARAGAGMGLARRFLGEKGRMPHNPDLLSQIATDAAHGYIDRAAEGYAPVKDATLRGHLSAEHATTADSYDTWKMASGVDKRRLGEEAEMVSPDNMAMLSAMQAQATVNDAAGGRLSARYATKVGRETGFIGAVGNHLDTAFHLSSGEYPEGPVTRGDLVGWDGMPTRGYTDNGLKR